MVDNPLPQKQPQKQQLLDVGALAGDINERTENDPFQAEVLLARLANPKLNSNSKDLSDPKVIKFLRSTQLHELYATESQRWARQNNRDNDPHGRITSNGAASFEYQKDSVTLKTVKLANKFKSNNPFLNQTFTLDENGNSADLVKPPKLDQSSGTLKFQRKGEDGETTSFADGSQVTRNKDGLIVRTINAKGEERDFQYDADGLKQVTYSGPNSNGKEYDHWTRGTDGSWTSNKNPEKLAGISVNQTDGSYQEIASAVQHNYSDKPVKAAVDANGKITQATSSKGEVRDFAYDAKGLSHVSYKANGKDVYDSWDRQPDGSWLNSDGHTKLQSIAVDKDGTYTEAGLTKPPVIRGHLLSGAVLGTDADNNKTLKLDGGTIQFGANHRVEKITNAANNEFSCTYDDHNQLNRVDYKYSNGRTGNWQLTNKGWVDSANPNGAPFSDIGVTKEGEFFTVDSKHVVSTYHLDGTSDGKQSFKDDQHKYLAQVEYDDTGLTRTFTYGSPDGGKHVMLTRVDVDNHKTGTDADKYAWIRSKDGGWDKCTPDGKKIEGQADADTHKADIFINSDQEYVELGANGKGTIFHADGRTNVYDPLMMKGMLDTGDGKARLRDQNGDTRTVAYNDKGQIMAVKYQSASGTVDYWKLTDPKDPSKGFDNFDNHGNPAKRTDGYPTHLKHIDIDNDNNYVEIAAGAKAGDPDTIKRFYHSNITDEEIAAIEHPQPKPNADQVARGGAPQINSQGGDGGAAQDNGQGGAGNGGAHLENASLKAGGGNGHPTPAGGDHPGDWWDYHKKAIGTLDQEIREQKQRHVQYGDTLSDIAKTRLMHQGFENPKFSQISAEMDRIVADNKDALGADFNWKTSKLREGTLLKFSDLQVAQNQPVAGPAAPVGQARADNTGPAQAGGSPEAGQYTVVDNEQPNNNVQIPLRPLEGNQPSQQAETIPIPLRPPGSDDSQPAPNPPAAPPQQDIAQDQRNLPGDTGGSGVDR